LKTDHLLPFGLILVMIFAAAALRAARLASQALQGLRMVSSQAETWATQRA
jgi:hypothetical protein